MIRECTIVIMGATGDLSRRKLIPAIYKLVEENKVNKFALVGVSLVDTTIDHVLENSKEFIPSFNPVVWQKFKESSFYYQVDFYTDEHYAHLKSRLEEIEQSHGLNGNRLFYLATMPEHFSVITHKLAKHGIATKRAHKDDVPWYRVVYEKPFGYDLASARTINKAIAKVFTEDQVFRIDHYLGKELVGNITIVRFTNLFFEPLWNKKYIDSVQIVLSEKIGIEGRGAYYDPYGALKDMVQNHMLQMLALVAMEQPKKLAGEDIRNAKAKVFSKLTIDDVLLGQYEGYQQEKGVRSSSTTETFAALKVSINNNRWQGVPFFLKTGKHLDKHETSIHIKFKQVACLLMNDCPVDSNYLTIRIQPDAGFFLELNAKVPDRAFQVTPVKMDFCHSCIFGPNTPQAYEVLLLDAMRGDQSVFVRFDEIELSWKIIDAIASKKPTVYSYAKGSSGPCELEEFNKKHTIRWRA